MNSTDKIKEISKERSELIERLLKALEHLPRHRQFAVLTSFLSLSELREITEFQERR